MDPTENTAASPSPPGFAWPAPRRKFDDRISRHALLFLLTVATTTVAGGSHYWSFLTDLGARDVTLDTVEYLLNGFWYSGTILAILGCHELGHYYACRYYDVDASLPFFIPAPLPLTGTLGAFIRIREPIPTKRMLFDIGIAGPIAGFVVAVPTLFLGLSMSTAVALPDDVGLLSLGEPLLFKGAAWAVWGTLPEGMSINMHPMAFASWFGLLATALNLFPIGQLDGGHIAYAVLGRKSSHLTLAMVAVAIVLAYFSSSWIVWTGLMIAMLFMFGRHHPRTFDEQEPLDATRLKLALFALAMFVLCFTPSPIEPMEIIGR